MKHINILFLARSLEKGGSERQLFYLIRELLKKKSYTINIVSVSGGYYESEYKKLGITPIIFTKSTTEKKSLLRKVKPFFLIPKLMRTIQRINPDIVHSTLFHTNIMTKIGLLFSKKTFKLVCGYRSPLHFYSGLPALEGINMKAVDATIANSKAADADLVAYKDMQSKRNVIYNGFTMPTIDTKKVQALKKTYAGKQLIITVGRMRAEKDYPTNVEVAAKVIAKNSKAHFLYVGDGEESNQIKKRIEKHRIEKHVTLLGKRDDIAELLAASDLFFLPTKIESQSNAVIEAMAAGLPIVTTNIPANREILDGTTLCPVGDVTCMQEAIINILNGITKVDTHTLQKQVKNKHSISTMSSSHIKLYEALL